MAVSNPVTSLCDCKWSYIDGRRGRRKSDNRVKHQNPLYQDAINKKEKKMTGGQANTTHHPCPLPPLFSPRRDTQTKAIFGDIS